MQSGIDAKSDGTGFVRAGVGLDAEAAQAVPDLSKQLRVDDLRMAGWTVTGPAKEGDGLTWVRASKPFDSPAQATRFMAELGGPTGPFRNFVLRQDRTLLRSRTSFSGVVDLSAGLSGLIDPDLQSKLGADFKLDDKAFKVEVAASLPGASRTWHPVEGQQTRLQLSSSSVRLVPAVPAALAVVCAAAAAGMILLRRRR